MAHLHPEINGDCNRVMRAIRTDTGESSLIGQDCRQELNRVCKGAEEQLSGS